MPPATPASAANPWSWPLQDAKRKATLFDILSCCLVARLIQEMQTLYSSCDMRKKTEKSGEVQLHSMHSKSRTPHEPRLAPLLRHEGFECLRLCAGDFLFFYSFELQQHGNNISFQSGNDSA